MIVIIEIEEKKKDSEACTAFHPCIEDGLLPKTIYRMETVK